MLSLSRSISIAVTLVLVLPCQIEAANTHVYHASKSSDVLANRTNIRMSFSANKFSALVLTKTKGFSHASIPSAKIMIKKQAGYRKWNLDIANDLIRPRNNLNSLQKFDVIIFLLTTGTIFSASQQVAFQKYVENGGAVVAIHSGMTSMPNWRFFSDLMGARFGGHPRVQHVRMVVKNRSNPSMKGIPKSWVTNDEIYNLAKPVKLSTSQVFVVADETSYNGGINGNYHPITWGRFNGKARSRVWVTTLGHNGDSYIGFKKSNQHFQRQVVQGIEWAAAGTQDARKRANSKK